MKLLRKIKRKFVKSGLNIRLNAKHMRSILYYHDKFERTKNLKGDVVECGVGEGISFQILSMLSQIYDRSIWGIDSFEGYSKPAIQDKGCSVPEKWKYINEKEVYETLERARLNEDFISQNVKTVKGFFKDIFPLSGLEKIAILHLDIGLYENYMLCLKNLYPKVENGGVIMFDEYKHPTTLIKMPGASKAIDEYLGEKKSEIKKDELTGKYYLIK
jgi:hypothetical protein